MSKMTTAIEPLTFSLPELHSYLPTGWELADEGRWNPEPRAWLAELRDGAGVHRLLVVSERDAAKLGRIEALKAACLALHRRALK